MGYCPFESRYNGLYRDTELGRPGHWGVCHDTIGCIVTGGGLAARLCREISHDIAVQALRHSRAGARYDARHGMWQERGLRYNFCIVTEGNDTAL